MNLQMISLLLYKLTGTIPGVCLLNVLLGLLFLGAIAWSQSSGYSQAAGWISVLGASVIFGSTGLPFKTESFDGVSVDPILLALCSSIGIFLVSLPLTIGLVWNTNEFSFDPWSLLGSIDILGTTFLAFHTVQQVGYAKGPAIWATTGMIFSFLLGALAFQEPITNMVAAVVNIPCLVTGMLLILSCQATTKDKETTTTCTSTTTEYSHVPVVDNNEENTKLDDGDDVHIELTMTAQATESSVEDGESTTNNNNNQKASSNSKNSILWGLSLGILTGLVDGSLMVPFKLTHASTERETYQYLASFGFSSLLTAPLLFALYYGYLSLFQTTVPNSSIRDQIKVAAIPGLLNGILWGLANVMSVTATFYLDMRIAFPLTQTCVLWATGWGMLYFHEIETTKATMGKLSMGFGCFMLGTVLLAESSSSSTG